MENARAGERAVILALFFTGLREQELCHLAWDGSGFQKENPSGHRETGISRHPEDLGRARNLR